MSGFVKYDSWRDVMDDARRGSALFYQAPMDPHPTRLYPAPGQPLGYEALARTIKIWPPGSTGRGKQRTADPFTADSGHLDRFRRKPLDTTLPAPTAAQKRRAEGPFAASVRKLIAEKGYVPTQHDHDEVQRLMRGVQTRPYPGESPAAWNERHAQAVEEAERNTPAGEARRQRENEARLEAARRKLEGK